MADNGDLRPLHDAAGPSGGPPSTSFPGNMSLGKLLSEHAKLFSGENAMSPSKMAAHAVLPPEPSSGGCSAPLGQPSGLGASALHSPSLSGLGKSLGGAAVSLDDLRAARAPLLFAGATSNGSGSAQGAGGGATGAFASANLLVGNGSPEESRAGALNLRHVLGQVQHHNINDASSGGGGVLGGGQTALTQALANGLANHPLAYTLGGGDTGFGADGQAASLLRSPLLSSAAAAVGPNTLAAALGGIARSDLAIQQQQQALGGFSAGGSPQHLLQQAGVGAHFGVNVNGIGGMVRGRSTECLDDVYSAVAYAAPAVRSVMSIKEPTGLGLL